MTSQPPAQVIVRSLAGAGSGRLSRWLDGGDHLLGRLRPLVGPDPSIIAEISGDRVPAVPGAAEAAAVSARRSGAEVRRQAVRGVVRTRRELVGFCRDRGRASVTAVRADPSLLTELQVGAWFVAGWRSRTVRWLALALPVPVAWLPPRLAADVAFWAGVREVATSGEWRRLTASSYVVLCYHRLAGRALPGQERMDVAPRAFRRQLRALQLLGWRALSPQEVLAFHTDPTATLPRRRYVLTADDGFDEAVRELTRQGRLHPQMFVVTDAVGGAAGWLDDAPLAGWEDLDRLTAAGGVLGSHARHHVRLDDLDETAIRSEVSGSLADLRQRMDQPVSFLAYPHGAHDLRVRAAARDAGYELAYTTAQGRNGAGTDRWCLRRVEPKLWDGALSFAWKVLMAESPPGRWERRLEHRWRARRAADD